MNINSKIQRGVGWSFINQGYNLLSQFTFGIFLARILGPEAYGTVAMVTVFSSIGQMFMNFGFTSALVQKKDSTNIDYSTIFWFNLLVGFALSVTFYFGSNLIASFYKKPDLVIYGQVISCQFILSALAITQSVQLTKKIDFKTKTKIAISSNFLSYIVGIFMALNGFGVWSIIAQLLTSRLISIVLLYYFVGWIPMLEFSATSFKSMYKFGSSVTADSLLNYFARNTDNLLIGKYLGDNSLGIYSKSYNIILFPIKNFSNVIKQVLFPSFSLIQSNVKLIRDYYLKVTSLIIFLIFPLMLILFFSAESFVLLLFGSDWKEMIPLVKIFSFLGMVQSVLTVNGTIYLSLGKALLAFKISIFTTIILLLAISIGVYTGRIINVAYGLAFAQVINFYPLLRTSTRLIDLKLIDMLKRNLKIFIVLAIASCCTYVISTTIFFSNNIVILLLNSLTFSITYVLMSFFLDIEEFFFLIRKLREIKRN